MTAVVFLGPTLPVEQARAVFEAEYLPPAALGDVYRALRREPSAIGIVDGYFEHTPSVRHKEILLALSRRVRVYGASSMGALRAAELHSFGMIGVGHVFERFRDGLSTRDDEVAIAHADAEQRFRRLSEALVNIRDGLARARALGHVSERTEAALLAWATAQHYPHRSWPLLYQAGQAGGLPQGQLESLRAFVEREQPDLKRDDALELLRRMRDDEQRGVAAAEPGFEFHADAEAFFATILEDAACVLNPFEHEPALRHRGDASGLSAHVAVAQPHSDRVQREALYLLLLAEQAFRLGHARTWVDALEQVLLDPRDARGRRAPRTAERIARLEEDLIRRWPARVRALVPTALAVRGDLRAAVDSLRDAWSAAARRGLAHPAPEEIGVSREELLDWYVQAFPMADTALTWVDLGVSTDAFLAEVTALYLARRAARSKPAGVRSPRRASPPDGRPAGTRASPRRAKRGRQP
jgi:hypothetical protein